MPETKETSSKTVTNLPVNTEAALTYVFGWITGLIFLLASQDKKIKFHAIQSIAISVVAMLWFWILLPIISVIFAFLGPLVVVIGLLWPLSALGVFVLWLVMIIKTYQGQEIVLPIVGKFAQKQVK